MPKFEEIEPGAYDPADQAVDEKGLRKAVADAQKDVDRIRKEQFKIRQETPKPKLLGALKSSDQELQSVIEALGEAERELGRFLRSDANPQRVAVGSASETETAGGEG